MGVTITITFTSAPTRLKTKYLKNPKEEILDIDLCAYRFDEYVAYDICYLLKKLLCLISLEHLM